MIPKYPEIRLLARCQEIYEVRRVRCTEKLHGSNGRIHFPGGMSSLDDVRFGSREVEQDDPVPFPLPKLPMLFQSKPELLTRMWEVIKTYGFSDVTIFGELYGPGVKAKGVKYSLGSDTLFRGFHMMLAERFADVVLYDELCKEMELPKVPIVYEGEPSKEAFDALLEKPSVEGLANGIVDPKNVAEGIVIQSVPLFFDVYGQPLICKHKSARFAEVAEAPKEKVTRPASVADEVAAKYTTSGRMENAVGRLADRGAPLQGTMADMPKLLAEVVSDILKEHGDEYRASGEPEKQLTGAVSKILAPLYRAALQENR